MRNARPGERGRAPEEILDLSVGIDNQDCTPAAHPNQARRSRFARDMAIEEFGFRTWRLGGQP